MAAAVEATGFAKGGLSTVTSEDKVGSRMPMAITDSDDAPQLAPGTGTDIAGTSAKLGLGGSAAIAIDKSVFIAGTAGDSIGTGERLQLLTDDGWQPIMGEDGKPIWGSEVVTSMGFMALKVRNAAGKTVMATQLTANASRHRTYRIRKLPVQNRK